MRMHRFCTWKAFKKKTRDDKSCHGRGQQDPSPTPQLPPQLPTPGDSAGTGTHRTGATLSRMVLQPWTPRSQNLGPGNSISGLLPWGSQRGDQGWVTMRGDTPDTSLKSGGISSVALLVLGPPHLRHALVSPFPLLASWHTERGDNKSRV